VHTCTHPHLTIHEINLRTGTISLYIGLNSYYSMFIGYEQASTPYN
jgi:hypothetical protein